MAFPVADVGQGVAEESRAAVGDAALAVWTTTAWTLPANQAVAVNGEVEYALVEATPKVRRRVGVNRGDVLVENACYVVGLLG